MGKQKDFIFSVLFPNSDTWYLIVPVEFVQEYCKLFVVHHISVRRVDHVVLY